MNIQTLAIVTLAIAGCASLAHAENTCFEERRARNEECARYIHLASEEAENMVNHMRKCPYLDDSAECAAVISLIKQTSKTDYAQQATSCMKELNTGGKGVEEIRRFSANGEEAARRLNAYQQSLNAYQEQF
jgi:hypothetical protein